MAANTKVNPNITDYHQTAAVQTNTRFYLILTDYKLSNQFSVHFSICKQT